ncbi:MAG: hypothetical protein ACPHX8_06445 [Candidatus Poseidoniaceae archaeon]
MIGRFVHWIWNSVSPTQRTRKKEFLEICQIVNDYRSWQTTVREHTWGTIEIDGGGVKEAFAAAVFGLKGRYTDGQAPGNRDGGAHPGDFTNGADCKSGDRASPNIEFRLRGTPALIDVRGEARSCQFIRIDENFLQQNPIIARQLSPSLTKMHSSIQSESLTVQVVEERNDEWYASKVPVETSGHCIVQIRENDVQVWNKDNKEYDTKTWNEYLKPAYLENHGNPEPGTYIRMKKDVRVDVSEGEVFNFIIRLEDGHANGWNGDKMLDWLNAGGLIFVDEYLDSMSRRCVAVSRLSPTESEMNQKIHAGGCKRCSARLANGEIEVACGDTAGCRNSIEKWSEQGWSAMLPGQTSINMRLWEKDRTLKQDNWSYLRTGVELAALAVQTPKGFKLVHWAPQGGVQFRLSNEKIQELLIKTPESEECSSAILHAPDAPVITDYGDATQRRTLARAFFEHGIVRFYREMNKYSDKYHLARNVKFSLVGEMMALLWFGIRGCRTKKGGDAYEEGEELVESEVKTVVGQKREDFLGSSNNNKVIHLNDDITNLLSQRRWFFVRIVDPLIDLVNGKKGGNFQLAIFTLSQENIAVMHRELVRYFSRTDNVAVRGGGSSKGYRDDPQFQPTDEFEDNFLLYGWNEHGSRMQLLRVAEFIENPSPEQQACNVLTEPPVILSCQCDVCFGGGAYWDSTIDRSQLGAEYVNLHGQRLELQTEMSTAAQDQIPSLSAQILEINEQMEEIGRSIGQALIVVNRYVGFSEFWDYYN